MSDPFLAEIRIFAFGFAPIYWAQCDGQLMPISQNTALFSLLGTNYGGDGKTTFGLPQMQGNIPMAWGDGPGLSPRVIGEMGGTPSVTLLQQQMPNHNHALQGNINESVLPTPSPVRCYARSNPGQAYTNISSANGLKTMSNFAIGFMGENLPHNNLQPYLGLNFCIALRGIFPPRG